MRPRSAWVCAFTLAAVFVAGAQPYLYVDSGSVPEPWSGWWWPVYDGGPDGGPYLWQGGGGQYGDDPGPIYDLDTRYFWWQGPRRTRAQHLEYEAHRTTDPNHRSWGHCHGVSFAQALEPQPPADNGALSQDDLEGLLSELYCWCAFKDETEYNVRPSDLWRMLQWFLGPICPDSGAVVVDFCRLVDADSNDIGWNWPVYGYKVEYNMPRPDYCSLGVMTLYFEDHKFNTVYAPESAKYEFWCKMDGPHTPRSGTGGWGSIIFAPCDPPNPATPPDIAFKPTVRQTDVWDGKVNYWLWSDSAETTGIRRVIDHKTIVMDDEYCWDADPDSPPSCQWVRRPGYSDSCWAAPSTWEEPGDTFYCMSWRPRLGCSGYWRFEVYKTPRYGNDVLNDSVRVFGVREDSITYYNQNVGPYDVWQPLGDTLWLPAGPYSDRVYMSNLYSHPYSTLTYFDAFRAEYVGSSRDGGASSSAVALGDASQRVRVTPNPVRSTARISYTMPSPGRVDVVVYDVMGRAVLRVPQDIQRAGLQNATISLDGLPAGAYIARVNVGGEHSTCRFVVCR